MSSPKPTVQSEKWGEPRKRPSLHFERGQAILTYPQETSMIELKIRAEEVQSEIQSLSEKVLQLLKNGEAQKRRQGLNIEKKLEADIPTSTDDELVYCLGLMKRIIQECDIKSFNLQVNELKNDNEEEKSCEEKVEGAKSVTFN